MRLSPKYHSRRYNRHFLLFSVSVTLVILYHVKKEMYRPRLEHMVLYEDWELGYRDPNVTCKFPLHHPFDQSILSYVRLPNPVVCYSSFKQYLQIDDDGFLCWNATALMLDGYDEKGSELTCSYKEILRPEGNDMSVIYGEEKTFPGDKVKLNSDFVSVECSNWWNLVIYRDFLAFAQKRNNTRKYKDGEYDVLVVGLDSVSRLNFMRQLPKAYKLLTGHLNATVFIGFNKVGHNTFPNVVPMLTGRPFLEKPHLPFKDWPFLWKDFAAAGASTMYTEDLPNINMFDYLDEGIDEQPTHHYMHTFWLAAEASLLLKSSSRLCLGPRPKHDVYFSYIKSFLKTYADGPKFLFSLLNEPTHDYVNTAGVVDDVLTEFLNSSHNEGLFKRSFVFVLGDHGNRLDSLRSTEIGKIEDYMPMVAVIVPPGVDPSWKRSVKANSNRFTSTYDLYATFVQVLATLGGKPGVPGKTCKRVFDHFSKPPMGHSLLKEVPVKRDCEDAGVPEWYCVCNKGTQLMSSDLEAKRAAQAVVDHINKILSNFTLCENLTVGQITQASQFTRKDQEMIEITFEAQPSRALFQAGLKVLRGSYLVGDIERINRYGSQAACLGEEILSSHTIYKAICYCKGQ